MTVECDVGGIEIVVSKAESVDVINGIPTLAFKTVKIEVGCVVVESVIQNFLIPGESNASDVTLSDHTPMVRHNIWVRVSSQKFHHLNLFEQHLRNDASTKFLEQAVYLWSLQKQLRDIRMLG